MAITGSGGDVGVVADPAPVVIRASGESLRAVGWALEIGPVDADLVGFRYCRLGRIEENGDSIYHEMTGWMRPEPVKALFMQLTGARSAAADPLPDVPPIEVMPVQIESSVTDSIDSPQPQFMTETELHLASQCQKEVLCTLAEGHEGTCDLDLPF
jgi:hypothetical protein